MIYLALIIACICVMRPMYEVYEMNLLSIHPFIHFYPYFILLMARTLSVYH